MRPLREVWGVQRRAFLATMASASAASLAGCTSLIGAPSGGADRPPWSPTDPIADPAGVHHLFIENRTQTTETAWIRVDRGDGATLVDGRYELPDERAIKFDAVAGWEHTHSIRLAIDGGAVRTLSWDTDPCGDEQEASGSSGSRNAFVRLHPGDAESENRVSLVVDECDALYGPELPTGNAEVFRLD